MPSSSCAVSGLSHTLCANTSDSQRVFTKVVRPVPEAPASQAPVSTHAERGARMCRRDRNGGRPCALADEIGRPRLTDDHDGELDTLLDLVSSASAGERHGWDGGSVVCA